MLKTKLIILLLIICCYGKLLSQIRLNHGDCNLFCFSDFKFVKYKPYSFNLNSEDTTLMIESDGASVSKREDGSFLLFVHQSGILHIYKDSAGIKKDVKYIFYKALEPHFTVVLKSRISSVLSKNDLEGMENRRIFATINNNEGLLANFKVTAFVLYIPFGNKGTHQYFSSSDRFTKEQLKALRKIRRTTPFLISVDIEVDENFPKYTLHNQVFWMEIDRD